MKNPAFAILLFALITACDPCPDCGEPLLSEPTAAMIFINQDSIVAINNSLDVIAFNDSAIISNSFILDTLRTRLVEVELGLDTSENADLEQEKILIEQLIPGFMNDSSFYATLNKDADSLGNILRSTRTTINSGLLRIDELSVLETGATITYEDSASSWNFPLLFDATAASYEFTIDGESYAMEITYETFTEVDQQRTLLVRAENIQVVDTQGFDSLLNCEINCFDGNASFTFYF